MSSEMIPTQQPAIQTTAIVINEGDLLQQWENDGKQVKTSLLLDQDDGKEKYMRCLQAPTHTGQEYVGKPFMVRDWLIHLVQLTNPEDGETFPALRLVLQAPNNDTLSTCSEALLRGWAHVLKLYQQWPMEPPLEICLKQVKAKGPGHYLQFEYVRRHVPSKNGKK